MKPFDNFPQVANSPWFFVDFGMVIVFNLILLRYYGPIPVFYFFLSNGWCNGLHPLGMRQVQEVFFFFFSLRITSFGQTKQFAPTSTTCKEKDSPQTRSILHSPSFSAILAITTSTMISPQFLGIAFQSSPSWPLNTTKISFFTTLTPKSGGNSSPSQV